MQEDKKVDINKHAYALKYSLADVAPRVVAGGRGYLADKILEKGTEQDIPTYYSPELVMELAKVDIGDNIPPELYEVVAQILVFIGNIDRYKMEEQVAKNAQQR